MWYLISPCLSCVLPCPSPSGIQQWQGSTHTLAGITRWAQLCHAIMATWTWLTINHLTNIKNILIKRDWNHKIKFVNETKCKLMHIRMDSIILQIFTLYLYVNQYILIWDWNCLIYLLPPIMRISVYPKFWL